MTKADRSFQVIKTGSLWLVVAGFDASQTRLETMGGPKDRLRNVYGGGGCGCDPTDRPLSFSPIVCSSDKPWECRPGLRAFLSAMVSLIAAKTMRGTPIQRGAVQNPSAATLRGAAPSRGPYCAAELSLPFRGAFLYWRCSPARGQDRSHPRSHRL